VIVERTCLITVKYRCDGCEKAGASSRLVDPVAIESAKADLVASELRLAQTVSRASPWIEYGSKHFCQRCAEVLRNAGVIPTCGDPRCVQNGGDQPHTEPVWYTYNAPRGV
jgi:hypothetical protein